MPRRNFGQRLERKHIHLFEGDWDWFIQHYGPKGLTPSKVIASILNKHRRRVEDKIALATHNMQPPATEELELDITPDDIRADFPPSGNEPS